MIPMFLSKKMATDSDTETAVDAMWHTSQSESWFVHHKNYWQWEWEWKWATEMYKNFTLRLLELKEQFAENWE